MRAVRLIAAVDEYDNSPGLKLADVPDMDGMAVERTDGILIAHDLLEHQNGLRNIGTVWDELEALGGIWQVRGRHGDMMMPSKHSPQVNIASDVTRMFRDWRNEDRRRVPATYACDYDDDFDDILNIARPDITAELEDADELNSFSRNEIEEYLTEARARMRIGFRKAQKRFGTGYAGHSLFYAVKEAAARTAKFIDFEGQKFRLLYGNGEARIVEINREEW